MRALMKGLSFRQRVLLQLAIIVLLFAVTVVLLGTFVWESQLLTAAEQHCQRVASIVGAERGDEFWTQCVADDVFISKAMQRGMSRDAAHTLLVDTKKAAREAELQAMLEQSPAEFREYIKKERWGIRTWLARNQCIKGGGGLRNRIRRGESNVYSTCCVVRGKTLCPH